MTMSRKGIIPAAAIAAMGAAVLIGVPVARAAGYRIVTSVSVPPGVWKTTQSASVQRGQFVLVCPPDTKPFRIARDLNFIHHGRCPNNYSEITKPVAAVEGDLVEATARGFYVNGRLLPNTKAFAKDSAGHVLPQVKPGRYRVAAGEVWLLSSFSHISYDSRYFGPVPIGQIQSVVEPRIIEAGSL